MMMGTLDIIANTNTIFNLVCAVCLLLAYILPRVIKKKKLPRKAWFIIVPAVVYFIGIALVSPFNSDRYVMASLPLISMMTQIRIMISNLKRRLKKRRNGWPNPSSHGRRSTAAVRVAARSSERQPHSKLT